AAAEKLAARRSARLGQDQFDTASARGTLAIGLMQAGRTADAVREFKAAIPIMMNGARDITADDDTTTVANPDQRLQRTVEAYFSLLSRENSLDPETAAETFALADAIRGHTVQQALMASSARAAVKDPGLAELVRQEQDTGKQINALLGTLNNALSLPSA